MTTFTNDQITAGAAVLCDHGQPIGRNAAIEVADAMDGVKPTIPAADVLTIPTAIMEMPCAVTLSHFPTRHEMAAYKQGHRAARHAAADLVLARADELKALAAPSPQIAEKVELPPHAGMLDFMDEFGKLSHKRGWTEDQVRDAIAASRRAAGGERRITCPSCKGAHSGMGADGVEWDCPKCEDGMVAAPASVRQAAPAGWKIERENDEHYGPAFVIHAPDRSFAVIRSGAPDPTETILYRYFAAQPAEVSAGQAGQVAK